MIQDNSGVFVLSRNPLALVLYADLSDSYPAVFSVGSQTVLVLGHNLVLTASVLAETVGPEAELYRLNLPALTRTNLPGTLRKHPRGIVGVLTGERALVSEPRREPAQEIVSLTTGVGPAAYLRFSEKGDRLLVVSAHQEVFILDVKKTIEEFPAPSTGVAEHP